MNLSNENHEAAVEEIVGHAGRQSRSIIPILHAIQKLYNYLPEAALRHVCRITDISPAEITGISTFYSQFRHRPMGKHIIQVCTGTACHVKGSGLVLDAFFRELKIKKGLDTDPDGLFTLQEVACLGCCTIAPVVQIDGVTYGHVHSEKIPGIIDDFLNLQSEGGKGAADPDGADRQEGEIKIGLGSCCVASGSEKVHRALQDSFSGTGIRTTVKRVGCVGMCHRVPLLEINLPGQEPVLYDKVQPEDVKKILRSHFKPKKLSWRLLNALLGRVESIVFDQATDAICRHPIHQRDPQIEAFLGRQKHIATEFSGQIDPLDLDEYRNRGGFSALSESLKGKPDDVIEQIEASQLRGRGGAGFPTGSKWRITAQTEDSRKYIVCNGDEGDPGAFMDRMILESYPFRVIEGMIIAAYAVGANQGYLYIRAEYPLAVQRVTAALEQCHAEGILGENILGSGFSLKLSIMEGAGAFVCGEETALIASIEGKRGMPRYRPPFPAQQGLWGHSTLVNNCETLATVPWIMRNGPSAFTGLGTEKSKGTKVFSLAGKIHRGGLIEVPMGISINEIINDIGGGIEGGREFKAVQIGGPSGGCVPAELAHTRVDYEDLSKVGAMMGSGGLLVMDDGDCMVDIARYFLAFTQSQSCGKCTFCRIGTRQMLVILEKLCSGKGQREDLDKLELIAGKTRQGSLCGLGRTAPNPVLTTLTYFREEYEAHLQGKCPAKRCQSLITYSIADTCIGCTICGQKCPTGAIAITPYKQHKISQEKCIKCGTCLQVCPEDAVNVQ